MYFVLQKEDRLEKQEARLQHKAVNAALHGNIGRAIHLEVSQSVKSSDDMQAF